MSAPAMKPEGLPERMITARGGERASDCSSASSSRMTCCERVLAEVSGLSRVSHAMPWLSRSIFQAEVLIIYNSCGAVTALRARQYVEITHQWAMVGEPHIRHPKIRELDIRTEQDEVQLHARHARREGRQLLGVGTAQPGGVHEEVDLVVAPEGVEVPRHDHRFVGLHDQLMQEAQLVLTMAVLERQVHQEYAHFIQLQLDDQTLDAGIEVMEPLPRHMRRRQKGVGLLADNGHELVQRLGAVLALEDGEMPQLLGDVLGLIDHAGADGTGVDLDQAHHIGLLGPQKLGNTVQHARITAQVPGARQWQVKSGAGARRVADVVDDQTQR